MNKNSLFRLFIVLCVCLPLVLSAEDIQLKKINTAEDLSEEFCSHWQKGDLLVADGEFLLLFGGTSRVMESSHTSYPNTRAKACILGFGPAGNNISGDLDIGTPRIIMDVRRTYVTYDSLEIMGDQGTGDTLSLKAMAIFSGVEGEEAEIETGYRFYSGKGMIDITSTIKNTGKNSIEDIDYSLNFDAFSRYYFNPYHEELYPKLNFRTYQKKGHSLTWLDWDPERKSSKPLPGSLLPGETFEVKYTLFVDVSHNSLLAKVYETLGIKPEKATIHLKDDAGDAAEVVVEDIFSSTEFFRSFLDKPSSLEILLPPGIYSVRAHFFPAVCEQLLAVGEGKSNTCLLKDSPTGLLNVKIRDSSGGFVPGKVTFMGLDPTKTPYFEPEDPIESGRRWETFKNSRYPPEKGMDVELPVGTYLVHCSRGPEYSVDKKVVEVLEATRYDLVFHIDRVLETEGLISMDPHMHTRHSDGRISIPERLRSVVAEGVDVAVATDHNYVADYYPALKELGLNPYLAVVVGNEVSTSHIIHYNSYPVTIRKDEDDNGAIEPIGEEVSPMFEKSREKDPGAILQVNHPRSGNIGYFNNYKLDEATAVPGRDHFDLSFDVLEVMNGSCPFSSGNDTSIEDWLHLLNRGYYFPLVGSSDSHRTDMDEPGYSRTYIRYQGGEGDDFEWPALAEAIKNGRSFTSNGPLVDFRVNEQSLPGDILTALDGKVDVGVKVESAPWVSVDEVRIIVNGERKKVIAFEVSEDTIRKFDEHISLEFEKDSYIVIEVLGKKSLYPVLQQANRGHDDATFPYALTNPVFVDVDGNGKYDPSFQKN